MRKTQKIFLTLSSLLCMLLVLAGCTFKTTIAYTYAVDTGDKVKITLDTTDKYSMTSQVPFTISHHDETCSQGTFVPATAIAQYDTAAQQDPQCEILDRGTRDGIQYLFWTYNKEEYNYAILLDHSNTGILLGNTISEESARECFRRLHFSLED